MAKDKIYLTKKTICLRVFRVSQFDLNRLRGYHYYYDYYLRAYRLPDFSYQSRNYSLESISS